MWKNFKTYFSENIKRIAGKVLATIGIAGVILIGGFFAFTFAITQIQQTIDDKTKQTEEQILKRIGGIEKDQNDNYRILQQKIDSTSSAVRSGSQISVDPNLFQRLFNNEVNKMRKALLDSLPSVIRKELEKNDDEPESVANVSLEVKGDTVIIPAKEKYLDGYWGEVRYNEATEEQGAYYELILKPIQIDVTEVRTKEDPTLGQPVTYFTAIDRRTGEELTITSSNVTFLRDRPTGFQFNAQTSLKLSGVLGRGSGFVPAVGAEFDWLSYKGKNNTYQFLGFSTNVYSVDGQVEHLTMVDIIDVKFGK